MELREIGDYQLLKEIGEGGFSKVVSAIHKQTGVTVAIKVIPKFVPNDKMHQTRIKRELDILKKARHPFICQFYENFENAEYYFIVMEMVQNGTLLDYVNNGGKLSEKEAAFFFAQIVSVLVYLHETCNIAHRDLKAENVLLDRHKHLRIIDFGLSNTLQNDSQMMKTACGSPAYAAPEMISGEPYTMMTDIWSAGILLFAICASHLPFDDPNIQRLMHKILFQEIEMPSFFSRNLTDLIERMLVKDPKKRITLQEIVNHPWLSEYKSICSIDNSNLHVDIDAIFSKLTDLKYDVDGIREDLMNNITTSGTVAYNILFREFETETISRLIDESRDSSSDKFPYLQSKPMRNGTMPCTYNGEKKKKPIIIVPNAAVVASTRRKSVLTQNRQPLLGRVMPKSGGARPVNIPRPKEL